MSVAFPSKGEQQNGRQHTRLNTIQIAQREAWRMRLQRLTEVLPDAGRWHITQGDDCSVIMA